MQIKIKKLHPKAEIPKYQTGGAVGFDFHSIEECVIAPKEWRLVKTGLAFEIPNGFELQVRPRSGLALKNGVTVLNAPGTIDSDYRGEIGVILINHSQEDFYIEIGDRIAQGVVAEVVQVKFEIANELSQTLRGARGFGSSGVAKKD